MRERNSEGVREGVRGERERERERPRERGEREGVRERGEASALLCLSFHYFPVVVQQTSGFLRGESRSVVNSLRCLTHSLHLTQPLIKTMCSGACVSVCACVSVSVCVCVCLWLSEVFEGQRATGGLRQDT